MPATVTHAYFAEDVYDTLPDSIKSLVSPSRVRMFGQSSDPLMFYNLFNLKCGKDIRKLDKIFHSSKTRKYFITLINYIKNNNLSSDGDVSSFLVGFICHYVLDSNIHPYVFYKTGLFKKCDSNTYKYNNLHAFMETFFDNYLIRQKENINPYKFNIGKFCFDTRRFSNDLVKTIDYSFKSTYKVSNMGNIYYKALRQMKFSLNTFRKDRYGIKKFVYKLVDTFTPRSMFRFEAISYHYPLYDRHNFLNSDHSMWRNPLVYDITSCESFLDLYLRSLKEARNIIVDTFKYINGEDIDLDSIFTNKSYVTGLDCKLGSDLKYFSF